MGSFWPSVVFSGDAACKPGVATYNSQAVWKERPVKGESGAGPACGIQNWKARLC